MEAWNAWVYRLCDREDLFERSQQRIDAVRAQHPPGIGSALFYMYIFEGQTDALVGLVGELIETHDPLTLFVQMGMLGLPGWATADTLREDPRYRELIRGLNYPPNPWSVE